MPENLTCRTFSGLLRTAFRVLLPGSPPLPLELTEVTEHSSSPQVESFSLIFRGPLAPRLPQQIHKVEHDKLGAFDLFLVPIGLEKERMCYQAVFNRLRKHPE